MTYAVKTLIDVNFKKGGPCPPNLPKDDPGGPLLASVIFYFSDGSQITYPASFFEKNEV